MEKKRLHVIDSALIGAVGLFIGSGTVMAAPLNQARVSVVIHDVRLLPSNAAPRAAIVNDNLREGTAIRTGAESRTQLTFVDETITRLGQNTVFSFRGGSRQVQLESGALLIEVPKGGPAAQILTPGVTAGITGGTGLLSAHKGHPTKWLILEGVGEFCTKLGDCVTLHAGEMAMEVNGHLVGPFKFDVKLVYNTAHLIADFPPLPNEALIFQVIEQQEKETGGSPPPPPPGKDELDLTDLRAAASPSIPASTPSEFGTPATITSPNPYVITSGTVITTDPSITTNGVTDYGKIYRSPAQDGPLPTFLFGSTSAFDNMINFGTNIDPNVLPLAIFKFQSLLLVGNPTIDLGTGGTTKLALVGIDGISSGQPGGTLTFAGLDLLALITQAGSINLTSDVSFQNIGEIFIYARGTGSTLTLASPILGSDNVQLTAEGSMQLMIGITAAQRLKFVAGGDLVTTGPGGSAQFELDNIGGTIAGIQGDRGNITLRVGGNLSSQGLSLLLANNAGGNISGTGGDIDVTIGGAFTSSGAATFTIQNTTGTINDGGNVTFTAGGSISTSGPLSLLVENYDFSGNTPGHIGTGGNISVTTGGDLSAQSVNALINNRSGGQIDSPVSLTLSIGGALTTSGNSTDPFGFPTSLFVIISTRFDNTGSPALASTVRGDATLTINAGSASIGGNLSTLISNSGSTLNGNALVSLGITHDVSIQGEGDIEILNDADSATPLGGILHGSATLQVGSNNFTANALFAQIDNRDGAVIDSNAVLTFDLTGSFAIPGTNPGDPNFDSTVPGEADILISNQKRGVSQDSATSGGTIGGNALIQLSAASASTAGALDVAIDNFNNSGSGTGGTIGGNAAINLNISNTLQIGGAADFLIQNEGSPGGTGGTIGGDATINLTAANVTANSLLAQIDNTGGSIGGNAVINMNVAGAATVATDATVAILGSDGAASAAINFNGGSYAIGSPGSGGMFLGSIDGNGTITFNNASVHADMIKAGVFGANGVLNIGGGTLTADSTLKLYAPGSNGQLNFVSNVTLDGISTKILAANSVTIFNNVIVTIGDDISAQVYTNRANYTGFGGNGSTTGTFGGVGANNPQPLASAPPFGAPPGVPSSRHPPSTAGDRPPGRAIHIDSSTQLLALLDSAPTGRNGRVVVDSRTTRNSGNADHGGTNSRALLSAERPEVRKRRAPGGVPLR